MQDILRQLDYSAPLYNLLYFALIIFFCFFYVSIIFNPMDQADNMKKYGGFIPGIRPGKKTAEYIDRILTRLTFGGAIYLGLVSLLPLFLISGFRVQMLPWIGPTLERSLPRVRHPGAQREVLLRRHVAADRGRRGHGHGPADRVAADHAALRGLHEGDPDPRPAGLTGPASGRCLL